MKFTRRITVLRRAAMAVGCVLVSTLEAHAQLIPGYPDKVDAYDSREVDLLPRYCIHTQEFRGRVPGGNNPDEIQRWRSIMGETFEAMHHYCWGLMKTNRAMLLSRGRQTRQFYLADSIGEFDYVLAHAPKDFILLPEILTKKGQNLIRLGRGPLGILALEHAAALKPDYWPAYGHMSDYYKEAGDLKQARELIETGLSFSPEANALKTRLADLDALKDKPKVKPRPSGAQPAGR